MLRSPAALHALPHGSASFEGVDSSGINFERIAMPIKNALASVPVKDLTSAVHWYERLFGRSADSKQTELAQWQFEGGGGLQMYQSAERAGSGAFTLTVNSLAEQLTNLKKCGLDAGRQMIGEMARVVMIKDPDGNSIAFAETTGPMPETQISSLVRAYFSAYERKNRLALDGLLHDDFMFGSPRDQHLDRLAYFERCWPNSQNTNAFTIQKLVEGDGEAFVLYECEPKEGAPFCNAEYFCFDGDKISEVRVFYGSLPKVA